MSPQHDGLQVVREKERQDSPKAGLRCNEERLIK
jgi:hypothetical protein